MAIEFKTPTEIADQYLLHLKGLKPEVNTDQEDSDWWIRSRVVGGVVAGMYADQRKIADDAFPQNARRDALEKHLELYFGEGFKQATEAVGTVSVTGTMGSTVPIGTEFSYEPNGNAYQATELVTLATTTAAVPVQSVDVGQAQNLLEGAELTISSPPPGINPTAEVINGNLSDGRDIESNDEAAARILARVRNPIAGGTESDYKQWAIAADDSVSDANVIRYQYGPGTVGVVFTAGTTDIDQAIDNNQAIVRIPSDALVELVSDYIDDRNPLTDCLYVQKPTVVTLDVTVRVRFVDGDLSTIPAGQTLTQQELVEREVQRAIYKTPPGGRQFGATGFVVCSEIEEVLDSNLSYSPYTEGVIAQILMDRQVDDLSASGPNRMILPTEIVEPGTINVMEF